MSKEQTTTTCRQCGRDILERTAQKTGGLCRPCEKRPATLLREAEVAAQIQKARQDAINDLATDKLEFIRSSEDLEAVCSFLFDRVHSKWTFLGEGCLSVAERTLIAVETFFGETCNGGINQYLVNEGGAFAQELPEALARCGLIDYARIALDLRDLFEGEIPREASARWARIPGIESRTLRRISGRPPSDQEVRLNEIPNSLLEELDSRFVDLYLPGNGEDFRLRLAAYIRENLAEFTPGTVG